MPESTPRGYPVPVLSDAIDDGAGHLNAFWDLASAIDTDVAASAGIAILDRSASTVQVVNTAAETDLYRKTIAAGALGADGGLRLVLGGDGLDNTGAGAQYRLKAKLGATTVFDTGSSNATLLPSSSASRWYWALTLLLQNSASGAQSLSWRLETALQQLTAAVGVGQGSAIIVGSTVATEDTTVAKDLAVTVTMPSASANLDMRRRNALLEKVAHT